MFESIGPGFNGLLGNASLQALLGQYGQSPYQGLTALSGGVNRFGPSTPPQVQMPGNLASIFSSAGPFMQQALALAGQTRPPYGPVPGPGVSPPPPVHIAPPAPGGFQISPIELQRQWLSALTGSPNRTR